MAFLQIDTMSRTYQCAISMPKLQNLKNQAPLNQNIYLFKQFFSFFPSIKNNPHNTYAQNIYTHCLIINPQKQLPINPCLHPTAILLYSITQKQYRKNMPASKNTTPLPYFQPYLEPDVNSCPAITYLKHRPPSTSSGT